MSARLLPVGRPISPALAALVVIAMTGCGGSGHPSAPVATSSLSPSAAPSSAAPTTGPGLVAPLTGLPATAAAAARPAMAVTVGLAPGAPAAAGLTEADIVYTEFAERGLTRLIAVFQSRDAARVGPVTSTRPADPKLLAVFQGCVGYAGGSSGFVRQFAAVGVCEISSVDRPSLFPGGFTATSRLYATAPKGRPAPPPTSSFATPGQPLAAKGLSAATSLVVTPPGRARQTWTYDAKAKLWRSAVAGTPVSAATVEVLTMPYKSIVAHHPLTTLSSATVLGQGAATVVSGGVAVRGSWYRPSAKLLTNVVDGAQQLIHPVPGSTWVLLAPTGSTVVVR
jgi:hypothetical protein